MSNPELIVLSIIWGVVILAAIYEWRVTWHKEKEDTKIVPLTGPNLKRCRELLGLSRKQLAGKFGVSTITIYRWETGRSRIPVVVAQWIINITDNRDL